MTIRLVVIDDEMLVRKGVISCVDWPRYGIEIAGEAPDGVSGLELIRRMKPHIVLTDIKMPHMDGLELARQVRQEFPETRIMMLSVLEDFETVREALRLGAVDYVQKLLMKPDELLQAVLQIKQSLTADTRATAPTMGAKAADAPRDARPAEDEPAAADWLRGKDVASVERQIAAAHSYVVGKMYAKQTTAVLREADAASLHWSAVVRWFRQSANEVLREAIIGTDGARTLWFIAAASEVDVVPEALGRELQPFIEQCAQEGTALSVGISASFERTADRGEAALQAERAEQRRFFTGYGRVFWHTKAASSHRAPAAESYSADGAPPYSVSAAPPFLRPQQLAEFMATLLHKAEEQADEAFERLFPRELEVESSDVRSAGVRSGRAGVAAAEPMTATGAAELTLSEAAPRIAPLSETVVREAVYHWISRLMAHLREGGGSLAGTLSDYSPFAQAGAIDTYEELRAWCKRFHRTVRQMLHSRYRVEIHQAIAYTQAHYMKPLRVKEVAAAVNLSESYFSYLFSSETGKTFVQMLQEIRVEQSKRLLCQPGVFWVDVTEQVGFESPKYFSKIFKKHTGVTPAQYARDGGIGFGER